MTLPVSLPPTTEPITPTTDVGRAAPTILGRRRPAITSTVTSYKLPIPSAAEAPPPPPPYALPPGFTTETLAAATNVTFSVETPNPVNFCEWVPASLHVKVQREALPESSVVFGRVFGNKMGRRLTVVEEGLFSGIATSTVQVSYTRYTFTCSLQVTT